MTVLARRAVRSRETVLAALAIAGVMAHPGALFTTSGLAMAALLVTVAIGLVCVMASGGIDFSAGPVAAVAAGVALAPELPYVLAISLAVLIGVLCGLINGILVATTPLAPYLVTLAMAVVLVGAVPSPSGGPRDGAAHLPAVLWVAAVVAVIAHVVLTRTRPGMYVYFVGASEPTARLSGISPASVRLTVYVTAGILAALAGVLAAPELASVGGLRTELMVLTAVALGGASVSGGRGTVLGTVLGSLLCVQLLGVMDSLRVSDYGQQCVQVAVLLVVFGFNESRLRRQARVRPT